MSISRHNLTIVIVTLKSEKVIHDCIKSLNYDLPIIVVEQSNNTNFKNDLEKKYKNLRCILSNSNLGMGTGNNIGIREAQTDYVLILNPDVILEKNTIEELILAADKISNFSILSPLEKNFKNYGMFEKKNILTENIGSSPFKVDFVDGFSMLLNKKELKEEVYFDENIFMYLENNDLCKRVFDDEGLTFIVPQAKINHLAAKAVDKKYFQEVEHSRNWHWIWSKFYFNKKHYGFFYAFSEGFIRYLFSLIKFLFYFLTNNKIEKTTYFNRASGFFNAALGKKSWYRPNLND